MEEIFLSIKEFADKLRVHENTIRRSIKKGRIQAFRIGVGSRSIFRIPYSEINRIADYDYVEKIKESLKEKKDC